MKSNLLIVDDEQHTREGLELALEDKFEVFLASNPEEAFNVMESESLEVVLTDLKMGNHSGMTVIDHAIALKNQPVCIMMTAYGEVEVAVEAMKRGAFDFLTKPVNLEKLDLLIKRGIDSKNLLKENKDLHYRLDKKFSFQGILGKSPALEIVLDKVKLVGPSKATVLLTGDTGTGKELIAQSIHQNSDRSRGPFVPVHCAALPSNLLESELFGHVKGAFTSAIKERAGKFEAANGGTIFLDEVGDMSLSAQAKVLRALQENKISRVGSDKDIKVNVRVIAATNKNLTKEISEGKFREDLYHRLAVILIEVPSLNERRDDIPLLINFFAEQVANEQGTAVKSFSDKAIKLLQEYSWTGNIRELRNVVERLIILGEKEVSENDVKLFASK